MPGEPFIIAVYSPKTRTIKKKFYVIGNDHPNNIIKAANTGDVATLKKYFGNSIARSNDYILDMFYHGSKQPLNVTGSYYTNDLGDFLPNTKKEGDAVDIRDYIPTHSIVGGNEDNAEDDYFGDIDQVLSAIEVSPENNDITIGHRGPNKAITWPSMSDEYITGLTIYKYDKIYELMQKIHVVTGIPYYRCHLDYISDGNIMSIYRLYAGSLQNTNMIDMKYEPPVTIDKYLYDIKGDLRVWTMDTFSIVGNSTIAVVTDLNEVLDPSYAMTLRDDKYQFELVYYGFIIKYFPQMTADTFKDYIGSENDMIRKYPGLAKSAEYLRSQYSIEQNMLKSIGDIHVKDTLIGITRAIITNKNATEINIRSIFDDMHISNVIPEIRLYTNVGNVLTEFKKTSIMGSNVHIPNISLLKKGLTVVINVGNNQHSYLSIESSGRWHLKCIWNEEDFVTFDNLSVRVQQLVSDIFSRINMLGRRAFPTGIGSMSTAGLQYENVTVSLYWKKILSDGQFRMFVSLVDKLVSADILRVYDAANMPKDTKSYVFKKGMYKFDITQIDRILTMTGFGELNNHFTYLIDSRVRTKWDETYSGRLMKIVHRSSDIRIEVTNIDAHEFTLFQDIMNIVLNDARKAIGTPKIMETGTKKVLKKLLEQDPVLFNIKKYGHPVVYSRVCQKKMQPIVYQDEEYASLPDSTKKKLIKYHNFTYNKDAWYTCPGSTYKHLNFITGVHPLGYCLPCCFKTPLNEREVKGMRIFKSCITTYKGPEDAKSMSRHILAYGKTLEAGRIGKMPETMRKIMPSRAMMFGVEQYIGSLFCPMYSIGALAVAEGDQAKFSEMMINMLRTHPRAQSIMLSGLDPLGIAREFATVFVARSPMINDSVPWNDIITHALLIFWGIMVVFVESGNVIFPNMTEVPKELIFVIQRETYTSGSMSVHGTQPQWSPLVSLSANYFKTGHYGSAVWHASDLPTFMESLSELNAVDMSIPNRDITSETLDNVITRHVGKYNKCYGATIEYKEGTLFIPLVYHDYKSEGPPVSFAPVTHVNDYNLLMSFVDNFRVPGHKRVTIGKKIYDSRFKKYVGFVDAQTGLWFTHAENEGSNGVAVDKYRQDTIIVDFDIHDTNIAMINGIAKVPDKYTTMAAYGLYDYYLYDLICMQFFGEVMNKRNDEFHERLTTAFSGVTIRSSFDVILDGLGIHRNDPDFKSLVKMIDSYKFGHKDKNILMRELNDTRYVRDNDYFNKVIGSAKEGTEIIKEVLSRVITRVDDIDITVFPNVYSSCNSGIDTSAVYCNGQILLVKCDDQFWEQVPALIRQDMLNDIRMSYYFDRMFYDNVVDQFHFTMMPDEKLFVRRITESK